MTDLQAILAILSTVITSIMGLLGLWMREVLKQQRAYIEELNERIKAGEKREAKLETRVAQLERENNLLGFRLGKALVELGKQNPALAKALSETGEFKA